MARLAEYLARRDFSRTPEPGDSAESQAGGLALLYGMQKHDASTIHFDLRLEWDGALLSWAVTKGPSLRTDDKRLAVRTEDHPLSYLGFEGTIPRGEYGAGTVMLFDIGHWSPVEPRDVDRGLDKGHLRLRLHGKRLTGEWNLVRMKSDSDRENWLLIKADDAAAGRRDPVARYRRSVASGRTMREIARDAPPRETDAQNGRRPPCREPQLATLAPELPLGDPLWHELKFDGYRALAALGKGGPRLCTRGGQDWTDRFAALLPALGTIDCDSALIDGEVVAGADLQGFSALQEALKRGGPLRLYAFDLLERDGRDLMDRPLTERRAALDDLLSDVPPLGDVQLSPLVEGDPRAAFERVCAAGGEGLIAKRTDRPYRSGRSKDWLKAKCVRRDSFAIVGWSPSEARGRPFSSLALAARREGALRYMGRVGTGFDDDTMAEIASRLKPLARKTPPVEVPRGDAKGLRWVTPKLVAEVKYAETTADGRLRHAVFLGLREDVTPESLELDEDRMEGDGMDQDGRIEIAGISLSHPDRVVYPEAGLTKRAVAEYHADIADRMLEEVADRPLSLVRMPEGLAGERFFQKHPGPGFPDAVKRVTLTEADGDEGAYMYVDAAAGLVGAVQMGALEFHIQGVRRDRPDRPDRMVFDLDPDEALPFAEVASAAADLRDRLAALDLPSWALVTGGKGVHVVVPLRRIAGLDSVSLFARVFATALAQEAPDRFTASMSKDRRAGRIFVDWLRNARGATAIAPFSLRARTGAPVAVPVAWDELAWLDSAQAFGPDAARERGWDVVTAHTPVGLSEARVAALDDWARGLDAGE